MAFFLSINAFFNSCFIAYKLHSKVIKEIVNSIQLYCLLLNLAKVTKERCNCIFKIKVIQYFINCLVVIMLL